MKCSSAWPPPPTTNSPLDGIYMKNVIPFTETDFPNGYSRKDAQKELAELQRQSDEINSRLKRIVTNMKRIHKELEQGGRILETKRPVFKPPLN